MTPNVTSSCHPVCMDRDALVAFSCCLLYIYMYIYIYTSADLCISMHKQVKQSMLACRLFEIDRFKNSLLAIIAAETSIAEMKQLEQCVNEARSLLPRALLKRRSLQDASLKRDLGTNEALLAGTKVILVARLLARLGLGTRSGH